MTPRDALAQLFQLFSVFLFLISALVGGLLWVLPEWRIVLADALLHQSEWLFWITLGWGAAALLPFFGFLASQRGSRLYLSMGTHAIGLEAEVIRPAIERLFFHFRDRLRLIGIEVVGGRRLSLELALAPSLHAQEKEQLLAAVDGQLERLFRDRFGYRCPFQVALRDL